MKKKKLYDDRLKKQKMEVPSIGTIAVWANWYYGIPACQVFAAPIYWYFS